MEKTMKHTDLTYSRQPDAGSILSVTDTDMTGVYVRDHGPSGIGPGEVIAWEQLETPATREKRINSYRRKRALGLAALLHWRARGFKVQDMMGDEAYPSARHY